MKVALYTRVSTLDQAREGYSLAAQRAVLAEYCQQFQWEIVGYYSDEGISGKDIKHRPGMLKLLDDAKAKGIDIILIWSLSRFTRSVADLYEVCEMLNKYEVALVSKTEAFDTSTATGRAMMGMLGVFAQMEREITSERVSLAMDERAVQGKRTCSYVLGYKADGKDTLKIDEGGAKVVRFIFDKYLEHKSLTAVAEICSLRGYRGYHGKEFTAESIKKILTRPIYIGYNTYKGNTYKGDFAPIIDEKTFRKVQKMIKRR